MPSCLLLTLHRRSPHIGGRRRFAWAHISRIADCNAAERRAGAQLASRVGITGTPSACAVMTEGGVKPETLESLPKNLAPIAIYFLAGAALGAGGKADEVHRALDGGCITTADE